MEQTVKFAIIVDGKVEGSLVFPISSFSNKIYLAMKNSGLFVETNEQVVIGSSWDGTNFIPSTAPV